MKAAGDPKAGIGVPNAWPRDEEVPKGRPPSVAAGVWKAGLPNAESGVPKAEAGVPKAVAGVPCGMPPKAIVESGAAFTV